MDLITVLKSTGPTKDTMTYNVAASIEEGGEFPPMPVTPFGGVSSDSFASSSVSKSHHPKRVFLLTAGIFLFAGVVAGYLMVT